MKKKISLITVGIATGYIFIVLGLYVFQDKIIFQGTPLAKEYEFAFDQPFNEINIKRSDSDYFINTQLFNPKGNAKGTIIYLHGNADNLQRWGNYAIDFTQLGYQVLMIDYTGFGKSKGKPTEEVLYQNAEDVWSWAQHHLKAKHFIIYGRSLGTSVAAHLASQHQADQLILETPFYELAQDRFQLLFPLGLKYEFPTHQFLPKIDYPITIIQGTNDKVVPYNSALKLKPLLKPTDRFFTIENGGHKNLRSFEAYHQLLEEVL